MSNEELTKTGRPVRAETRAERIKASKESRESRNKFLAKELKEAGERHTATVRACNVELEKRRAAEASFKMLLVEHAREWAHARVLRKELDKVREQNAELILLIAKQPQGGES